MELFVRTVEHINKDSKREIIRLIQEDARVTKLIPIS